MADDVLLVPFLSQRLLSMIRFQTKEYNFYYDDTDGEECKLTSEPLEALSSIYCIKDEKGVWNQDDYNLCFKRRCSLRTFQCLFGENGIVCRTAKLGLAVIWTSSDSKQRGVIQGDTFGVSDVSKDFQIEKKFAKAQLRGEVNFSTILYIAEAGTPVDGETHLANKNGFVLGELDSFTIKLDGTGSVFPVFEVSEPGQPLWYIRCDWFDPTSEAFSETVSINLNKAHKNYKYIDRNQSTYDPQLLSEIMAAAVGLIVEKVRLQSAECWDQIVAGDDLTPGSVGEAIYYFTDTLGWDLSTPESVSLSARKFFDQRM